MADRTSREARANRPEAEQLGGTGERSFEQAGRRPEEVAPDAKAKRPSRREDLTSDPAGLAARFLSDAVQGEPREQEEEEAEDDGQELPVAEDESQLRDRSRAELPPTATPEGEPRPAEDELTEDE